MAKLVLKKKRKAYNPYIDGVSQSCLASFLNCRETARLRYIHNLEPKGGKLCFRQGKRMDLILKNYYENLGFLKTEGEAIEFIRYYIDGLDIEARKATNYEEAQRDLGIAAELLPAYIKFYYKIDKKYSWLDQGHKFENVPITLPNGKRVPIKGEFDGVFMEGLKFGLIENKFYSRVSDNLMDTLPLDIQLGVYLAAHEQARLCLFNIIRKPSLRQKANEPLKAFLNRIKEDIDTRKTWYFTRIRLEITKQEKAQAFRRVRALLDSFCIWWESAKSTQLKERDLLWNSSQCESKYGVCEYLPACAHHSYSDYQKRTEYGETKARGSSEEKGKKGKLVVAKRAKRAKP